MSKVSQVGNEMRLNRPRFWMMIVLLTLTVSVVGCHKKSGEGDEVTGQKTFTSPDEAAKDLVAAARSGNQQELLAIFGPDAKDVITTGNVAEDQSALAGFVSAFDRMNRWRRLENGQELLLVGPTNAAFPIPLRKDRAGKWYFDTPSGREELLARRIGRNELAATDVLAALADAQVEYFKQEHDGTKQYARKFISDPGKQNGLYWPQIPGKPKSPVGPLVAFASPEGSSQANLHQPFYGYYFRILNKQGPHAPGGLKDYIRSEVMNRGFAFVAYPADYGKSGVMTFIIDGDRVIYQKDLGPTTQDTAPVLASFNPDSSWVQVKQ